MEGEILRLASYINIPLIAKPLKSLIRISMTTEIPPSIRGKVKQITKGWMRLCKCGRWIKYKNPQQFHLNYAFAAALRDAPCPSCRIRKPRRTSDGVGTRGKYDNTTSGEVFVLPQSGISINFEWITGCCENCNLPFRKKYPVGWLPHFTCRCGNLIKIN